MHSQNNCYGEYSPVQWYKTKIPHKPGKNIKQFLRCCCVCNSRLSLEVHHLVAKTAGKLQDACSQPGVQTLPFQPAADSLSTSSKTFL